MKENVCLLKFFNIMKKGNLLCLEKLKDDDNKKISIGLFSEF